jgi:pyrrolidone-carboxylate peptidase
MNVGLTCFEDFQGIKENTSRLVVQSFKLPHQVLPVSFNRCGQNLKTDFDFLIQVGVAASRREITIERYAHNLAHSPGQADNDSLAPTRQKIIENAPLALETTIDVGQLDQLQGDWQWSLSAGSYVCNALYFKTLWGLKKKPVPLCLCSSALSSSF